MWTKVWWRVFFGPTVQKELRWPSMPNGRGSHLLSPPRPPHQRYICFAAAAAAGAPTTFSLLQMSVLTRGRIHIHCHKIRLVICLRTIAAQQLRYPKMITRRVFSEFTERVLNDREICHS